MTEEQWTTAVLAVGPQLFRCALRIVQNEALAEDVVGETYLRAWLNRQHLRNRRSLRPWLMRVCRNCAIDLQRRQIRRRVRSDMRTIRDATSAAEGPIERLSREELLERLPDSLKACARMHFVDGMGFSEIAYTERIPISTVRGRIYRARQELRKEIEMTAKRIEPKQDAYDDGMVPVSPDRTVRWRGVKIRLLALGWVGEKRLYSPSGKRLSRVPATVARSQRFTDWRQSIPRRYHDDPAAHVWVFLERSGANGYTFFPWTQMLGEHVGKKHLLCAIVTPSERDQRWLRLRGTLIGPVVQGEGAAVRVVSDLASEAVAEAVPGWGAVYAFKTVPGPREGTCTVRVVYSSTAVKTDWEVLGLSDHGRELASFNKAQAASSCNEGNVTGLTLDFRIPPDRLRGIVLRPRWHAKADWGKVRIPPRR